MDRLPRLTGRAGFVDLEAPALFPVARLLPQRWSELSRFRDRRARSSVCAASNFFPPGNLLPAWGHKGSILGPGEGHEAHEGNGAHPRFTWRDLFNHGELLWRFNGPQRHDKPATHFELFNQRRRDMPKCGRDDYRVERTAFQPSVITVADFDAHVVIAECRPSALVGQNELIS